MIDALLAKVAKHYPEDDPSPIRSAYADLERRHSGAGAATAAGDGPASRSAVGERALAQALETAQILADLRLDPHAVVAGLLARVVLRAGGELDGVRERWGADVAGLLEGVQRLRDIRWDKLEEEEAESLRKL